MKLISRRPTRRRTRGHIAAALLLGVVLIVPIPLRTMSQGVIWLPEHSHVRAGADGFVTSMLAEPIWIDLSRRIAIPPG